MLCVFVLTFFAVKWSFALQVEPQEQLKNDQLQGDEGKIMPSPKDIKEKIGIFVFVGWLWLSILVLVFILRMKIKEVDRLHSLKFFSTEK